MTPYRDPEYPRMTISSHTMYNERTGQVCLDSPEKTFVTREMAESGSLFPIGRRQDTSLPRVGVLLFLTNISLTQVRSAYTPPSKAMPYQKQRVCWSLCLFSGLLPIEWVESASNMLQVLYYQGLATYGSL